MNKDKNYEKSYITAWGKWLDFPNPDKGECLYAPLGCGVYQLRCKKTLRFVLFGQSKHVACRMSSLLLSGPGTRHNIAKREFVTKHLQDIQYRTMSLGSEEEARAFEKFIKTKEDYIFPENRTGKQNGDQCEEG